MPQYDDRLRTAGLWTVLVHVHALHTPAQTSPRCTTTTTCPGALLAVQIEEVANCCFGHRLQHMQPCGTTAADVSPCFLQAVQAHTQHSPQHLTAPTSSASQAAPRAVT
jgi:hypothetical protein